MLWNFGHSWFLLWNLVEAGFRIIVKILWVWEARHRRVFRLCQKFWLRSFTTDCIHEGSAIGSLSVYILVHCLHRTVSFLCLFLMILTKTSKLFLLFSLLSWDELWRIPRASLWFTLLLLFDCTSLSKINWFIRCCYDLLRAWIVMCLLTAFIFVFIIV